MIPPFLLGPLWGAAGLALALAAALGWLRLVHDPAVRAAQSAAIAAAVAAQQAADAAAAQAALETQAAVLETLRARLGVARRRIADAPVSRACADSPAVRAALDSVRAIAADDGAPAGAAQPPGVRAPAPAAR